MNAYIRSKYNQRITASSVRAGHLVFLHDRLCMVLGAYLDDHGRVQLRARTVDKGAPKYIAESVDPKSGVPITRVCNYTPTRIRIFRRTNAPRGVSKYCVKAEVYHSGTIKEIWFDATIACIVNQLRLDVQRGRDVFMTLEMIPTLTEGDVELKYKLQCVTAVQ